MDMLGLGAWYTHVGPSCRDKAIFAVALERAYAVDTACILAWINSDPWFSTLINICAAGAGVVQSKACVTVTHSAQVGTHTTAIGTTTLI